MMFVGYDICCIMCQFLPYDVCSVMTFVTYGVCCSAAEKTGSGNLGTGRCCHGGCRLPPGLTVMWKNLRKFMPRIGPSTSTWMKSKLNWCLEDWLSWRRIVNILYWSVALVATLRAVRSQTLKRKGQKPWTLWHLCQPGIVRLLCGPWGKPVGPGGQCWNYFGTLVCLPGAVAGAVDGLVAYFE